MVDDAAPASRRGALGFYGVAATRSDAAFLSLAFPERLWTAQFLTSSPVKPRPARRPDPKEIEAVARELQHCHICGRSRSKVAISRQS